jgi:hypothetical protein
MKTFWLHGWCVSGFVFLSAILPTVRAADTNPPPRLTVELHDGSRVVGESVAKNFRFHSDLLGEIKLDVKSICSAECVSSNLVKLSTTNGDSLTVSFVDSEFAVNTGFGKVELPVDSVRRFSVTAGGAGGHLPGLVAMWSGEGNGNDSVGGNPMTPMDISYVEGKVGQAFGFNGAGQWVNCGNTSAGNFGAKDFTVAFWVKFNTVNTEQVVVEKYVETLGGSGEPSGWSMTKLSNNRFQFAGATSHVDFGYAVAGTWTYLVVTRNNGNVRCYVNGVLVGQLAALADLDSTASLKLGHRGNPTDTPGSADPRQMYLNGALDEIAIYDRALSAEEIETICKNDNHGELPPATPSGFNLPPFNGIYRNGYGNGFSE